MQLVFLRPPCLLVSLWCILYVLCDLYWFCALLYCVLTCNLCSWDLLACLCLCDVFHIFCVLCTGCVLCYIVCLPATCALALETSLLVCAPVVYFIYFVCFVLVVCCVILCAVLYCVPLCNLCSWDHLACLCLLVGLLHLLHNPPCPWPGISQCFTDFLVIL